jgi:hypothetical protein
VFPRNWWETVHKTGFAKRLPGALKKGKYSRTMPTGLRDGLACGKFLDMLITYFSSVLKNYLYQHHP